MTTNTPSDLASQLSNLSLAGSSTSSRITNTSILSPSLREQIQNIVQETIRNLNSTSNDNDTTDVSFTATSASQISEADKVPDMVKCLREFSGKPGEFNSWRKTVDRILGVYESIKGSPKYYAILHVIRHKITGDADTALESYRTPLDWGKIKKCLMMHYSDRRDLGTLEYQLNSLSQGNRTITEYYQRVYSLLSLILDKVACLELSNDALNAMTYSYRSRALDTFVRGLNGDLPRLLSVSEPKSLPEALQVCLKLDNMHFRRQYAQGIRPMTFSGLDHGAVGRQRPPPQHRTFYPELAYLPRNNNYNNFKPDYQPRQQQRTFPQFPQQQARQFPNNFQQKSGFNNRQNFHPKPPQPMEVDRSLHSRQVNYQNMPRTGYQFPHKRPNSEMVNVPNKIQRNFFTETYQDPTEPFEGEHPHEGINIDFDPDGLYMAPEGVNQKQEGGMPNASSQSTVDSVYFLD